MKTAFEFGMEKANATIPRLARMVERGLATRAPQVYSGGRVVPGGLELGKKTFSQADRVLTKLFRRTGKTGTPIADLQAVGSAAEKFRAWPPGLVS